MKHFRVWFICGRFRVHEADSYTEVDGCVTFYCGTTHCSGGQHVAAIVARIEESNIPFPASFHPEVRNHLRPPA